jgi:GNAT superfamily N-acetyltransferase
MISLPPGYSVRFADSGHQPIRTWKQFQERCGEAFVGLYFHKVLVGTGELASMGGVRKNCHTDQMSLRRAFRRKGHGLYLYLAVIREAQKLGVNRIYSSCSLNKNSRRMWRKKLSKLFKVVFCEQPRSHRSACVYNTRYHGKFFIDLDYRPHK